MVVFKSGSLVLGVCCNLEMLKLSSLHHKSEKILMYVLSRNKHTISPYLIRRGFSKVPKTFRARKPFVKLQPANSVKLVFSYVVKGIKSKITAKFPTSRRLRFEYTKRIMSTEMRPKSFGTFEKRGPGLVDY